MSRRKRALPRGWYPFDARDCKRDMESYLEGWSPSPELKAAGGGGIVPHAGWHFSGKLAARVFYALKLMKSPDLVILYGGHLGGDHLPLVVAEDACETPLGDIEVHGDFVKALMKRMELKREAAASGDNTIEIQLAMVKFFFPRAKLAAIRSPHSLKAITLGEEVAALSEEMGISILAVGSTDLTHYGPNYGFLPRGTGAAAVEWVKRENDRGLIDVALRMDARGLLKHALENDSACSAGAAASAVATCKALGSERGLLLGYCTSYDILPDDSFVGYAGILY